MKHFINYLNINYYRKYPSVKTKISHTSGRTRISNNTNMPKCSEAPCYTKVRGGSFNAALPLHMQRDCFWIQTHIIQKDIFNKESDNYSFIKKYTQKRTKHTSRSERTNIQNL